MGVVQGGTRDWWKSFFKERATEKWEKGKGEWVCKETHGMSASARR